jgi:hypothetical protein
MKCTAHTKDKDNVKLAPSLSTRRCEGELHHAGLHYFTIEEIAGIKQIQEFNDSKAWYPRFTITD